MSEVLLLSRWHKSNLRFSLLCNLIWKKNQTTLPRKSENAPTAATFLHAYLKKPQAHLHVGKCPNSLYERPSFPPNALRIAGGSRRCNQILDPPPPPRRLFPGLVFTVNTPLERIKGSQVPGAQEVIKQSKHN